MAEPDYLEGDCDELIKPKKLINPVKNSRNHQDLHRELLMNQKRSGDRKYTLDIFPLLCPSVSFFPGECVVIPQRLLFYNLHPKALSWHGSTPLIGTIKQLVI